ncbi:hypothetical protein [Heyndrickxia coagulans]|uniref:hypothetical protein n=1 Tax=Heyndrickxia coagulans TaxID=1398 RepID=UPI000401ACBE|nr:hypothetical protein [Heyndrickxia coagulans]
MLAKAARIVPSLNFLPIQRWLNSERRFIFPKQAAFQKRDQNAKGNLDIFSFMKTVEFILGVCYIIDNPFCFVYVTGYEAKGGTQP